MEFAEATPTAMIAPISAGTLMRRARGEQHPEDAESVAGQRQ